MVPLAGRSSGLGDVIHCEPDWRFTGSPRLRITPHNHEERTSEHRHRASVSSGMAACVLVGDRTHQLIGIEVVLSTVRRPDRRTTTGAQRQVRPHSASASARDPQTKIRSAPAGAEDHGQQASVDGSLVGRHAQGSLVPDRRPVGSLVGTDSQERPLSQRSTLARWLSSLRVRYECRSVG